MVPPPKGKDLSRMSAPPPVSTTSEPSPVGSPAPVAAATAATTAVALASPSGVGGAPSPSPRTGKPKGKDFSRMAGPPPSTTPTAEITQPPPTVPVSQPPIHLQNNNINMQAPTNMNMGNNLATNYSRQNSLSSLPYAQPPPLVHTQPPQYQPLTSSAPMNSIQQQQQQMQMQQQLQLQQMQMQQQQQLQMQQQQQMQMQQPAIISSLSSHLNSVLVAPQLPSQRPSWSDARLSTMMEERGRVVTATQRMMMPPFNGNNNEKSSSNSDNNDGYGKPTLAPILGEKLQKLCHSIDPSYSLDSEVQERLVELADAFVEKVTKDAIKLAKHRGSSYMDVVDVALALKKGYNLEVPGLGPPSVASTNGEVGVGGSMGGRGSGTLMGGWMFADKVNPGEIRGRVGDGDEQQSSPKKTKRGTM